MYYVMVYTYTLAIQLLGKANVSYSPTDSRHFSTAMAPKISPREAQASIDYWTKRSKELQDYLAWNHKNAHAVCIGLAPSIYEQAGLLAPDDLPIKETESQRARERKRNINFNSHGRHMIPDGFALQKLIDQAFSIEGITQHLERKGPAHYMGEHFSVDNEDDPSQSHMRGFSKSMNYLGRIKGWEDGDMDTNGWIALDRFTVHCNLKRNAEVSATNEQKWQVALNNLIEVVINNPNNRFRMMLLIKEAQPNLSQPRNAQFMYSQAEVFMMTTQGHHCPISDKSLVCNRLNNQTIDEL